jgi:hypothetical protein
MRTKWGAAIDPLEKSFSGLMLYYAKGDIIDMSAQLRWSQLQLRSVRQFATQECATAVS